LTLGQLLVSLDSNGGFPNGSRIGDYPEHFIGRDNHGVAPRPMACGFRLLRSGCLRWRDLYPIRRDRQ
jgi:hypothetical protein